VAIERWDPFRDLPSMREAMDRLLRDLWGRPRDSRLPDGGDLPVDVAEKDNAFVVRATIPGVRPEDIQANVRGDRLTLWAESHNEQERKDERCVIRERYATSFYRALTLSSPVNTDQADVRKEQACCHVRAF
jgi:HSP20 family protein